MGLGFVRAWAVVGVVGLCGVAGACTVSKIGDVAGKVDALDAVDARDAADSGPVEDSAAVEDSASVEDTLALEDARSDAGPDAADVEDDTRQPPVCPWVDYSDGLKGGAVNWVGSDPRASGVMFAVAGGILSRSQDHGETWVRWAEREDGFGVLGFPSDDPKGVLSTSGSGLIASADGGVSYAPLALQGFGLRSLLVHPTTPQRVYVGTSGAGVLRSDNHGATWVALNVGMPLAEVRALAAPADRVDVALAGVILLNANLGLSNAGQILYTDNGGLAWRVALDGIGWASDIVYCDDDTVFAAVRKGIAKSVDGGQSFSLVPAFADLDTLHVAVSADCQTVYTMVYQKGMYRSLDGGETFAGPFTTGLEIEPDRQRTNNLVLDPDDPTRVFASTYAGLFKSEDGAESWTLVDSGNGVAVHTLSVSPAAPARLFASTWGSGTWLRHGPELDWVRVPTASIPRDFIYGTHADPEDPLRFYVGTADELWRTKDGGASYVSAGLRTKNVLDMEFLPGGEILAATQTGGVYRSADGGDVWVPSNGGLVPFATAAGTFIDARHLARLATGTLYLGTNGGGLYTSTDDGLNWTRIAVDQGVDRVAGIEAGPGPDGPLYAVVAARGVVKSDDGGVTWSAGSSGLASLDVADLVVDGETGEVFVATRRDGVFRTVDASAWLPFDRYCLPVRGFDGLAIMEDSDGTWLVGALSGGGVYRDRLR